MKERIFFDDEFDRQLREKADQFKMYPSDKVWNGVYGSLHTRRRKFVAGMAFLIGSILILAGVQLISPSKNINPKPVSVASRPGYSANGFVAPAQLDNTIARQLAAGSLNTTLPFVMHSGVSAEEKSGSEEMPESLIEKTEATASMKPVQPAGQGISGKSGTPVAGPDLNEILPSNVNNPAFNLISEELAPEKSLTRLANAANDRFSWGIYFAPTFNTHYLTGMNYQTMTQSIQSAPIMVVHIANVNGFVDNTPAMGYALGGNILYRISKNFSLKAGLEFSFNRYYIRAYNSNQGPASATLSSYLGYIADSLQNLNRGISTNKNPQHYQNRYYQISMPVGVEMKVAGNGRLQLHLGASLQPSYLLNTDAYVLSDDYNSYTKDAQAFRRWNLNAGAEAFISYGTGKIRWELGPQVRYQIFSTYKSSYPFTENMLNYGIRIGFSKTIR